jgi:hypothetical protein
MPNWRFNIIQILLFRPLWRTTPWFLAHFAKGTGFERLRETNFNFKKFTKNKGGKSHENYQMAKPPLRSEHV